MLYDFSDLDEAELAACSDSLTLLFEEGTPSRGTSYIFFQSSLVNFSSTSFLAGLPIQHHTCFQLDSPTVFLVHNLLIR